MERTPAACAMKWSIDLEKGLRSKKPGQSLDAILRVGPRLERWDREPAIGRAQFNMLGLIPGEDKLFANAIFLRLADAFCAGDKEIKLCVVKIFLSMLRNRKNRCKQEDGILFKCTLENRMELMRRVKTSFDTGDVESRALALILLGCWAEIAKDSAEIRYLILSSLCSCDILQVEASLFAGLCFSELSDDFSSILLEILVNMVKSSEILPTLRLAGVRAFAKMWYSSSLASKAYEAGVNLLSDFAEEDLLVTMLISLSKIASRYAILIPRQLGLLSSFLSEEKSLHLRATALKCIYHIVLRGTCFPATAVSVKGLISMLEEPELQPVLHGSVLQILRKVLLYNLATRPSVDMIEFSELFTNLENVCKSPVMAMRVFAVCVMVEISIQLMERKEKVDGLDSTALLSTLMSVVIDQIRLMVRTVEDLHHLDNGRKQEGQQLLNLLFLLVEKYPDLGGMVLDNLCLLIENIVTVQDQVMDLGEPDMKDNEMMEFRGTSSKYFASRLLFYASQVVVACLEKLNQAGAITIQVLDKMVVLAKQVVHCSLFEKFTCAVHSVLLHSHVTYYFMLNDAERNNNFVRNLSICCKDYLVQHELLALEGAKNLLLRKDNWSAYKIGKYAAHQGSWSVAAFIFENLVARVHSDSCCDWLKSLARFADSERKLQLLTFPEKGSILVDGLKINEAVLKPVKDVLCGRDQNMDWKLNLPNNVENLVEACDSLHSSGETMRTIITSGHALHFQTWFLALRQKVLQSVVDMLKLYTIPVTEDNIDNHGQDEGSTVAHSPRFLQWKKSVACSLNEISLRLLMLAREFNLLATSFMGIDRKSMDILSSHALGCSLLAFSTGFSLPPQNMHIESSLEVSEESLHGMLIHDLIWRLQHIDSETSTKLSLLWRISKQPKNPFFLQSNTRMLNISSETRGLLTACKYAVNAVVALQNEATGQKDNEILYQITKDGLQLLLDIIAKWMFIPFLTPSHFFRVRPCLSAELFAQTNDNINPDGISVLLGFQLSLSLCLQLKNVPLDLPVRSSKFYCILYCTTSFREPYLRKHEEKMQLEYQDRGVNDMLYLNDKLLQHVMSTNMASNKGHRLSARDCGTVDICVPFELNENGQGFSTCLLDVSSFPVGSYRIKWHSCCMDNEDSYWSFLPLNADLIFTVK